MPPSPPPHVLSPGHSHCEMAKPRMEGALVYHLQDSCGGDMPNHVYPHGTLPEWEIFVLLKQASESCGLFVITTTVIFTWQIPWFRKVVTYLKCLHNSQKDKLIKNILEVSSRPMQDVFLSLLEFDLLSVDFLAISTRTFNINFTLSIHYFLLFGINIDSE